MWRYHSYIESSNGQFVTILFTVSTLALTACGNTAASVSAAETEKNQVVENTTTTESETAVIESVIPETTETAVERESEVASSEAEKPSTDPNYNGGHYEVFCVLTLSKPHSLCILANTLRSSTLVLVSYHVSIFTY